MSHTISILCHILCIIAKPSSYSLVTDTDTTCYSSVLTIQLLLIFSVAFIVVVVVVAPVVHNIILSFFPPPGYEALFCIVYTVKAAIMLLAAKNIFPGVP